MLEGTSGFGFFDCFFGFFNILCYFGKEFDLLFKLTCRLLWEITEYKTYCFLVSLEHRVLLFLLLWFQVDALCTAVTAIILSI